MGMSEKEALDLEYAALLHDIGLVALREPIPGGATMLDAPADQDRIARDGAEIVRKTGVLDTVAHICESQSKPYRHVRELGENLPISSRILKVAQRLRRSRRRAGQTPTGERCHRTDPPRAGL